MGEHVVGALLGGVDRAAFVAALAQRLRGAGVPVTMGAMAALSEALDAAPPSRIPSLYWLTRLTLVNRQPDLEVFDRVFRTVFGEATPDRERAGPRPAPDVAEEQTDRLDPVSADAGGVESAADLPWHTLPRLSDSGDDIGEHALPELLPSAVARLADVPLDELDEQELAVVGRWLEEFAARWPTRRSRRPEVRARGRRVALRETIAASRRTGWEPLELQRYHVVRRPLTVVLLCDVSQSMQSWSTAYLHLMRAFARTRRAETFAFSTSLTRLTPALSHRSAEAAIAQANADAVDRYGGTRLASCLRELLASHHGNTVRGAVLVIASDGWDGEAPSELAEAMIRARRRTRRVVWLNPRAAAPGYEPLVGSMAAALPFCDAFLPAHTLRALPDVLDAIAGDRPPGLSSRG